MLRVIFFKNSSQMFFTFWRRLSWACITPQYLCLSLFLESLVTKDFKLNLRHKFFLTISGLFSSFFILMAFLDMLWFNSEEKPFFESFIQKLTGFYTYYVLIIISLLYVFHKLKESKLPRLLNKQLKIFLSTVMLPFWISDLIQITPFVFSIDISSFFNADQAWASASTISITIAIIYCAKRMLGLRFLNLSHQVQAPIDIDFMEHFKTILEKFSHVTDMKELIHITQGFFKESFSIPHNRVHLYIRSNGHEEEGKVSEDDIHTVDMIEGFLNHSPSMDNYIKEHGLLVYDEIVFSDFYEASPESSQGVKFLDAIQADIFLPIYEKDRMIAYIVVDRFARPHTFYSGTEYDEMLIFVRYLSNIINLLQNKNLDSLIKHEKNLKEELYVKQQEIGQYKESIRSFLRNKKHKNIGIIFYKNRRFTFGNQAAKELIQINPNVQEGHPITKALKRLAQKIETYKTSQTVHTNDPDGNKIVITGMPGLENNNVIMSIYYPEVTDVIKRQIDMLHDPSEWDYLLYLETTRPGKLINHLIPGSGETLLNFKIDLLKAALSKKALLLNMSQQDTQPMVDLLHHISLRESLYTMNLDKTTDRLKSAISLFGINALFNINPPDDQETVPLLEKLDSIGTLFIKNVEYLDLETQEYLAEFIRYGYFKVFKSEHKITSNVRIICSTTKNLSALVREGRFSPVLLEELKDATLEMPSLLTLPDDELSVLAEGFSEQAVTNQTYKSLLSLSEKDKNRLALHRPASLAEFKSKIQTILIKKSQKSDVYDDAQFDPTYDVSDPDLNEAAKLGKQALKDQKIMTLLWNKFKNQNKIASFLGVNRSSVNRRCKQYGLEE